MNDRFGCFLAGLLVLFLVAVIFLLNAMIPALVRWTLQVF